MGILQITVKNSSETVGSDGTDPPVNNKKEALKLITFMLYYAYYNTFEDPLNKHLYDRILDNPSEKSSRSFALSFLDMLKTIETQSKSIEEDEAKAREDDRVNSLSEDGRKAKLEQDIKNKRNSEIIAKISDLMATNLEVDLFEELNSAKIIKASTQLQVKTRQAVKHKREAYNQNTKTALLETNKYYEEKSELYRMLNQEKYMCIILALKTISIGVEGHNNNLLYKLTLQDQDYKKEDAVDQLLDELAEKDWERVLTNRGWNKDERSIIYDENYWKRREERSKHSIAYKARIKEELKALGITGEFTVEQLAEKQALREKRTKAATNLLYNMAKEDWKKALKVPGVKDNHRDAHIKDFIERTEAEWKASGKTYESIGQELLMEGNMHAVAKANTLEAVNLLWKKPEKLSENNSLMKAQAYLQKYKSNMELSKDYVKKSFKTLEELIAYKKTQPNYQEEASSMWTEAMSNLNYAIANIKSYEELKFLPELEKNREVKYAIEVLECAVEAEMLANEYIYIGDDISIIKAANAATVIQRAAKAAAATVIATATAVSATSALASTPSITVGGARKQEISKRIAENMYLGPVRNAYFISKQKQEDEKNEAEQEKLDKEFQTDYLDTAQGYLDDKVKSAKDNVTTKRNSASLRTMAAERMKVMREKVAASAAKLLEQDDMMVVDSLVEQVARSNDLEETTKSVRELATAMADEAMNLVKDAMYHEKAWSTVVATTAEDVRKLKGETALYAKAYMKLAKHYILEEWLGARRSNAIEEANAWKIAAEKFKIISNNNLERIISANSKWNSTKHVTSYKFETANVEYQNAMRDKTRAENVMKNAIKAEREAVDPNEDTQIILTRDKMAAATELKRATQLADVAERELNEQKAKDEFMMKYITDGMEKGLTEAQTTETEANKLFEEAERVYKNLTDSDNVRTRVQRAEGAVTEAHDKALEAQTNFYKTCNEKLENPQPNPRVTLKMIKYMLDTNKQSTELGTELGIEFITIYNVPIIKLLVDVMKDNIDKFIVHKYKIDKHEAALKKENEVHIFKLAIFRSDELKAATEAKYVKEKEVFKENTKHIEYLRNKINYVVKLATKPWPLTSHEKSVIKTVATNANGLVEAKISKMDTYEIAMSHEYKELDNKIKEANNEEMEYEIKKLKSSGNKYINSISFAARRASLWANATEMSAQFAMNAYGDAVVAGKKQAVIYAKLVEAREKTATAALARAKADVEWGKVWSTKEVRAAIESELPGTKFNMFKLLQSVLPDLNRASINLDASHLKEAIGAIADGLSKLGKHFKSKTHIDVSTEAGKAINRILKSYDNRIKSQLELITLIASHDFKDTNTAYIAKRDKLEKNRKKTIKELYDAQKNFYKEGGYTYDDSAPAPMVTMLITKIVTDTNHTEQTGISSSNMIIIIKTLQDEMQEMIKEMIFSHFYGEKKANKKLSNRLRTDLQNKLTKIMLIPNLSTRLDDTATQSHMIDEIKTMAKDVIEKWDTAKVPAKLADYNAYIGSKKIKPAIPHLTPLPGAGVGLTPRPSPPPRRITTLPSSADSDVHVVTTAATVATATVAAATMAAIDIGSTPYSSPQSSPPSSPHSSPPSSPRSSSPSPTPPSTMPIDSGIDEELGLVPKAVKAIRDNDIIARTELLLYGVAVVGVTVGSGGVAGAAAAAALVVHAVGHYFTLTNPAAAPDDDDDDDDPPGDSSALAAAFAKTGMELLLYNKLLSDNAIVTTAATVVAAATTAALQSKPIDPETATTIKTIEESNDYKYTINSHGNTVYKVNGITNKEEFYSFIIPKDVEIYVFTEILDSVWSCPHSIEHICGYTKKRKGLKDKYKVEKLNINYPLYKYTSKDKYGNEIINKFPNVILSPDSERSFNSGIVYCHKDQVRQKVIYNIDAHESMNCSDDSIVKRKKDKTKYDSEKNYDTWYRDKLLKSTSEKKCGDIALRDAIDIIRKHYNELQKQDKSSTNKIKIYLHSCLDQREYTKLNSRGDHIVAAYHKKTYNDSPDQVLVSDFADFEKITLKISTKQVFRLVIPPINFIFIADKNQKLDYILHVLHLIKEKHYIENIVMDSKIGLDALPSSVYIDLSKFDLSKIDLSEEDLSEDNQTIIKELIRHALHQDDKLLRLNEEEELSKREQELVLSNFIAIMNDHEEKRRDDMQIVRAIVDTTISELEAKIVELTTSDPIANAYEIAIINTSIRYIDHEYKKVERTNRELSAAFDEFKINKDYNFFLTNYGPHIESWKSNVAAVVAQLNRRGISNIWDKAKFNSELTNAHQPLIIIRNSRAEARKRAEDDVKREAAATTLQAVAKGKAARAAAKKEATDAAAKKEADVAKNKSSLFGLGKYFNDSPAKKAKKEAKAEKERAEAAKERAEAAAEAAKERAEAAARAEKERAEAAARAEKERAEAAARAE
jgi:hypothetical protein